MKLLTKSCKSKTEIFVLCFLQGLRTNWSELHHVYQGLSLLTDTLPKKNRREKIEGQLDELEKFIELLEKHPIIVITDNPYLF